MSTKIESEIPAMATVRILDEGPAYFSFLLIPRVLDTEPGGANVPRHVLACLIAIRRHDARFLTKIWQQQKGFRALPVHSKKWVEHTEFCLTQIHCGIRELSRQPIS